MVNTLYVKWKSEALLQYCVLIVELTCTIFASYLIISYFSPSKSSRFLTTPSPDDTPKGGAVPRDPKKSPKKGIFPPNRDGTKSDTRQVLDKNIKQLFGARMASKGMINLYVEIFYYNFFVPNESGV